jgi:hypothetical protein
MQPHSRANLPAAFAALRAIVLAQNEAEAIAIDLFVGRVMPHYL